MKNNFNDDFEIQKTKSISKIIFVTILTVVIVFISIILTLKYILKEFDKGINLKAFYLVEKSISLNKKYVIEIKGNGARWPFGSEDIMIVAYENTNTGKLNKKIFTTELANDGGSIGESNYNIDWSDESASIRISGEEQKNEYIFVDFKNDITFKHKGLDYRTQHTNETKIIKSYSHYDYYSNRNVELYNASIEFLVNDKYISMEECFTQQKIDIEDFIITMDYEVEDKIATKKWENQGNADVYKNDDVTLIVCRYDRYNPDYETISNENYLKYIISDNSLNYSYELCKP